MSDERVRTPRATWKGVLQISLVTIPIKVYPATAESEKLAFNQLHGPCQTRIQQKKWCPLCNRETPTAEIVKGFEFEKGRYVLLLEEELDAVQPPSTKVIALTQFVRPAEVELRMIDRAYHLAPDGPDGGAAGDAYALLGAAMAGHLGIGTMAVYGREYPVAIDPYRGSLLLYTLHPAAELRTAPYAADLRALTAIAAAPELNIAKQLVAGLTRPWRPAAFTDSYQVDLRRLIDAKIAGQEIVQPIAVDTPPVANLRQALEQSLQAVSGVKTIPTVAEKLRMAKAEPKLRKRA